MKISISDWQPFKHDNFEYKKRVIDVARQRDNAKPESVLMAVLIYVNAVDYVASHLLKNLKEMKYLILHNELNGTIFEDYEDGSKGLPLGAIKNILSKYEFPDKKDFIGELNEFNLLRTKYIHNFLNIPSDELEKVGLEIDQVYKLAESILNRYDGIARAIAD